MPRKTHQTSTVSRLTFRLTMMTIRIPFSLNWKTVSINTPTISHCFARRDVISLCRPFTFSFFSIYHMLIDYSFRKYIWKHSMENNSIIKLIILFFLRPKKNYFQCWRVSIGNRNPYWVRGRVRRWAIMLTNYTKFNYAHI